MNLRINYGKEIVPIVPSKKYKITHFKVDKEFRMTETGETKDGQEIQISTNVKAKIEEAWRFVTEKAAAHKRCNNYFRGLTKGLTLKEVLKQGPIIVHRIQPLDNYTTADIPFGTSSGRDIGINPGLLYGADISHLACTLIHELAHVAGATTDPNSPQGHDAEKALDHCLCHDRYDRDVVGETDDPASESGRLYRIA